MRSRPQTTMPCCCYALPRCGAAAARSARCRRCAPSYADAMTPMLRQRGALLFCYADYAMSFRRHAMPPLIIFFRATAHAIVAMLLLSKRVFVISPPSPSPSRDMVPARRRLVSLHTHPT